MIESLQRLDYYYGETFLVEFPTGSGNRMTIGTVAMELEKRLLSLFVAGTDRSLPPSLSHNERFGTPGWKDLRLFHEYFDAETGRGLGASHQTGWTALIAKVIQQLYVTAYADRV